MLQSSSVFFKGKLNLIFKYFSTLLSELLVIDLIRSIMLIQSSSHFFLISLLSLAVTSAKYLFPLTSSQKTLYFIDNKV